MPKALIIAEKPSVAQDIAKALGRFKKESDYFENDSYVIAAAAGHLVELCMPEDIDAKQYRFWQLGKLPIMPDPFEVKPVSDKRGKDRLTTLKKLIKRKDVDLILNACDAGREGELIFTYIYQVSGSKKPYKRVWMQSMTRNSITEAFANLRSPEQMAGLEDAARSRSEADWLIGINATRAVTKRMFGRGKGVATVGRVQTPTLSIVFDREKEIRSFKPRDYWRIHGHFEVEEGSYEGILHKSDAVDKSDNHDKADRLWEKAAADNALEALNSKPVGAVSDEKKRTRQSSGRLYDLTSLQREANGRFGFSAARTLQVAQSLYERHTVVTYPRTDSRALPEDYIPTVKETLGQLDGDYRPLAGKVLENNWVTPNKRIFNNAQISDHFAIIPTGEKPSKLTAEEEKIFDMVTRRFIAIFYPPAEFDVTTRTTMVGDLKFHTEGKVLVKPGYLDVYGRAAVGSELPALTDKDKQPDWLKGIDPLPENPSGYWAKPDSFDLEAEQTKPPSRFTEATLLSAMEGAGKLVEDDELAEAMKEKGLGTPATRASTIDHLVKETYLERDAKFLVPTAKAERLFDFLSAITAEELTRPDLTGEWEHKLRLMEQNKLDRSSFMKGIRDMTQKVVDRVKNFEENEEDALETTIVSPTDNKPMKEYLQCYKSQDGEITIYKTIAGRKFEESEVQQLVKDRQVGPLDDFRSKAGKPFSAILRLDAMNKVSFDFGESSRDGENGNGEPINLEELAKVGVYAETGETVYEAPNAYACARSLQGEKDKTFRISRTMLGKTLAKEDIEKMLKDGKTDLIKGFKSKRTGRNFDAFLLLKKGGGIGFEFPPRAAKKAAKKATKKPANSETD